MAQLSAYQAPEITISEAKRKETFEALEQQAPADLYLSKVVQSCHDGCKTICDPWHKKITDYIAQYEGGDSAPRRLSYSGGLADLYPNLTREAVDTIWGVLVGALFPGGTSDFFNVQASDIDSFNMVQTIKHVMRHFIRLMGFQYVYSEASRTMGIAGLAVLKHGWDYRVAKVEKPTDREARPQKKLQPSLLSKPQVEYRRKYDVVVDEPFMEEVDPRDFFVPDDKVRSINELDYCGFQYWTTRRALEVDEVRTIIDPKSEDRREVQIGRFRNVDLIPKDEAEEKGHEDDADQIGGKVQDLPMTERIHNIEYFFRDIEALYEKCDSDWKAHLKKNWGFDDEDLEGGVVVTLGNRLVPIRIEPMEDPTGDLESIFTVMQYMPRKGSIFSQGIAEMVRSDQIEITALHNQGLDIVTMALCKRWFLDVSLNMDQGEFDRRRPQQVIPFNNPLGRPISDLVYEDVPSGLPNDFYNYIGIVRQNAERGTGATDIILGMPTQSRTSATEISARSQNAQTRFETIVRRLEWGPLANALKNVYRAVRRNVRRPLVVQIMGEDGTEYPETIERGQIWGDFRFVPVGMKETANRFVRSQQGLQLLDKQAALPYLDVPSFLRDWLMATGDPDAERKIIDPNRARRMKAIEKQWMTFLAGQEVRVSGRESFDEHMEAIRAHSQVFLGQVVPGLRGLGISPAEIEQIIRVATENIEEHQYFVKRFIEQQKDMMAQMQMQQAMKGRRQLPMLPQGGPTNELEATSPGREMPAALPNATGMTG